MMKRMKWKEKKNVSPLPFYIIQLFPSRNFLNKDQHNLCNHGQPFFFSFFFFFFYIDVKRISFPRIYNNSGVHTDILQIRFPDLIRFSSPIRIFTAFRTLAWFFRTSLRVILFRESRMFSFGWREKKKKKKEKFYQQTGDESFLGRNDCICPLVAE